MQACHRYCYHLNYVHMSGSSPIFTDMSCHLLDLTIARSRLHVGFANQVDESSCIILLWMLIHQVYDVDHLPQLSTELFGRPPGRETTPSFAAVVHTFEAVAGSWRSVSALALDRVMGGAPERNKNSKNI